jgi:NADP-dependent 3-hydroxy acid dehydrogenase YdfG
LLTGRNPVKIENLKPEFDQRVHFLLSDVSDYSQAQAMAAMAVEKMGGIDVLVNNAGLGFFEKIVDGRIEQWHQMIDVNIKGVLNCLHACLPHLVSSSGLVIQVASVAAHHVFPNSGVYCATKHAVAAISESLRLELSGKIRVSTISPGAVNTNFINTTTDEEMLKEYKNYFETSLPAETIAEQIRYCVNCPESAVISEIILRPNRKNK